MLTHVSLTRIHTHNPKPPINGAFRQIAILKKRWRTQSCGSLRPTGHWTHDAGSDQVRGPRVAEPDETTLLLSVLNAHTLRQMVSLRVKSLIQEFAGVIPTWQLLVCASACKRGRGWRLCP